MENPVVFVGRLPRNLTRKQLEAGLTYWFSYYDSIRLCTIRESRYQIYAFVEYDHPISARAAVTHLHNEALFGTGFEANKVSPAQTRNRRFHPHRPCRNCDSQPPWRTPPPPQDPVYFWWFRPFDEEKDNRVYWDRNAQPAPAISKQLGQQWFDFLNQHTNHHLQQHPQPPHVPQPQEDVQPLPEPQQFYVNPRPIEQLRQLPQQQANYQLQAHAQPAQVPQPQEHVQQLPEPQDQEHRTQPEWEAPFEQQLTQEQIIAQTMTIFPDIDPSWVAMQAANRPLGDLSMYIVENMDTVPKAPQPQKRKADEPVATEPEAKKANFAAEVVQAEWVEPAVDYLSVPLLWKFEPEYQTVVEQRFAYDFPQISLPSLRTVLDAFGYNYAPAYAALHEELAEPVWAERAALPRQKAVNWDTTRPLKPADDILFTPPVTALSLLAIRRVFRQEPPVDARLRDEVVWIQRHFANDQVVPANDAPNDAAALEECGICVEEVEPTTFEECESGHRFCSNCIRTQARESALGLGGGKVVCLEHGCGVEYTRGVLARVLDETLLRQVDEAAGEQALAAAGLDNLVRCKRCNWGAIIDEPPQIAQIFLCRNEACCCSWCRLCDREYDKDHTGKMCAEVETDAEAAARKKLEEALTAAVVRRCHRCALPFQKTQGCNKMTCTCGATSCYLCRLPDVNYDHFCGHKRRDPNRCTVCAKRCALFEDSDRVDQDRLNDVQRNAF